MGRGALVLLAVGLVPAPVAGCRSAPPRVLERGDVAPRPALDQGDYDYRIGPRDVLRVNVFGHPELSSPPFRENTPGSPVDGGGYVQLPLAGAVQVGGLTAREAAARIAGELERWLREPRVDVAVVEHAAHRFLVLGEVMEPGVFPLDHPTTAMEALAMAGGLARYANREQIAWVRGSLEQPDLVLLDASEIDPRAGDLLAAGDVIFVGRRNWADVAEAARDLIPVLQTVSIPLSLAIQAATLEKID